MRRSWRRLRYRRQIWWSCSARSPARTPHSAAALRSEPTSQLKANEIGRLPGATPRLARLEGELAMAGEQSKQLVELYAALQPNASLVTPFEINVQSALDDLKRRLEMTGIHFSHVRSRHQNALPILLSHGWPGSVLEVVKVIGPLTEPTRPARPSPCSRI